MKIAVISDIHSNLCALKSVLEDIKTKSVSKIFCLGDIIGKGINAEACVNLVKKSCDVVLAGNTDIRFSSDANLFIDNKIEYERIKWNQSLLSEKNIKYLQSLPICHEMTIGDKLVRFFHATPKNAFDFVNDYDTDMYLKYSQFLSSENCLTQKVADIIIFGHQHYQFLQKLYNKTLINCGSVGNSICLIQNPERNSLPNETTNAHYLILDYNENAKTYSFCFESVPYDIQTELQSNSTNIDLSSYQRELEKGCYRDLAKVYNSFKLQGYDISKF